MHRSLVLLVLPVLTAGCPRSGGPGSAPAPSPAPADRVAEPQSAAVDDGLGPLARLRFGMRPGLAASERPSSPDEAVALVAEAGGRLDCGRITWISDEDGVLDGTCEGRLTLAGQPATLALTFRRFELPGEDGRPGLLTIQAFGPALDATELEPWLAALRQGLEAAHGPGRVSGADLGFRLDDRFVLLHDPRNVPCGGLCTGSLWIGGRDHPELGPRGFATP